MVEGGYFEPQKAPKPKKFQNLINQKTEKQNEANTIFFFSKKKGFFLVDGRVGIMHALAYCITSQHNERRHACHGLGWWDERGVNDYESLGE